MCCILYTVFIQIEVTSPIVANVTVQINTILILRSTILMCGQLKLQQKGVKGASVLFIHKPYNLCTGTVIDVMHCAFLGVMAKTLMVLWFDAAHRSKPFSIRRKVCIHIRGVYIIMCTCA